MDKLVKITLLFVLLPLALAQGDAIKIGFMGPLTGGAAFIGVEQFGFVKVAADIFNTRTGLNVEIVEGDTEINPDTGRIVAERFVADEDIIAVVGPSGSQVCDATQPIFEEGGMAHVTSSCTATFLTDPGTPTFFRPIPNDALQSQTVVDIWLNDFGLDSALLVDDQSTYAVNLNDEVENLLFDAGISDIDRISVTQDETDFSSIATSAVAGGFDVVFFPNQITSQAAALAIQLDEQGYDGIFFMPDGGFTAEWVNIAGEVAEGAYVTFFAPDPHGVPTMEVYNLAYQAEFSEDFGAFGGGAAIAAFATLGAVEVCAQAGDLSRTCMIDALTNLELDTTPMNVSISFGPGNQGEGDFFLYQVQNGAFSLIQR
jgi:branched-chain amino acid transport system substrate-binding protein